MTRLQKTIIFLNYFGSGLFAPVLSLFLLSHGCDLKSLSLVIGIYSAIVIVAEVPSGMFADLRGRKNAFLLSAFFIASSFILMYFSRNLRLLIPGIVLLGLGAAFLSGSLDSLIIEDCIRRNGDASLPEATGSNLIFQCAGIASGALIGGVLPNISNYILHIIARLLVLLIGVTLSAAFLREAKPVRHQYKTFSQQSQIVISELKGNRHLRIVLVCIFGSSISLFALETYWQPQFSLMIAEGQNFMLGILCAMGYGGNMLGSILVSRLKMAKLKKRWLLYLLFLTLMGCGLGFLSFQQKAVGFLLSYTLVLTMLGAANVPEQTILNSQASNQTRASLLSVASLFSKMAGVFSSVICAALILPIGISGVWLIMGGLTVFAAFAATAGLKLRVSSKAKWSM